MNEFLSFIKLVALNYFKGVMGWILNLIGLISLFVSIKSPVLPIWIGVVVLLLNAFLASFLAWKQEARRVKTLESELRKIKDSTPHYSFSIGDLKKYTARSIIDDVSSRIDELEKRIEEAKKPVPQQASGSPFGGIFSSMQMIKQLQSSLAPAMRSLGHEDDESKISRLKKYHKNLKEYENKLENLYQISLSIESTRHDKNVEVEIQSSDTFAMTVRDDYESDNLPKESYDSDAWLTGVRPMAVADKYYLESSVRDNKAYSELAYINASRPTNVFDSTFYIHSKKDSANLIIKVHSTKLTVPQVIENTVDLTNIPVIQIKNLAA